MVWRGTVVVPVGGSMTWARVDVWPCVVGVGGVGTGCCGTEF